MIEIKSMQRSDLPVVAAIEKRLFSEPWSENGFLNSLASDDTRYLTAWFDGQIAGYCGYLRSFEEADITNVAVDPIYQRKGVALDMLTHLMEQGRADGIERFTLEVRVSNEAAIRLYEKLGFTSVGIRKRFYSHPVEDANIMWTNEADSRKG